MSDASVISKDRAPLVTVALAIFNAGTPLESAVRSILNQNYFQWRLLLIDDGSTDGAIDRLTFLNDSRIVVIRDGFNRGHAARLNQAIEMTNTKYFARMDQDDICNPERLARQVAYLEGHPDVDLLAVKCRTIDEEGRIFGELPYAINHIDICNRPWKGFYMPHPSWMGKTEWFRRHQYKSPAPYSCEDQELLLRAHRSSKYHTLEEYLLEYRVRIYEDRRKLWKTYWAMLKFQLKYFIRMREPVFAIMSILVAAVRALSVGFSYKRNASSK
jgi:glycosyltransferase involved in cell wall biosynthesis